MGTAGQLEIVYEGVLDTRGFGDYAKLNCVAELE
jgi:hypothetical protein